MKSIFLIKNLSDVSIEFKLKGIKFFTVLLLIFLSMSCTDEKKGEKQIASVHIENLEPEVDLVTLQSDFKTWWTYYNNHIELNENAVAFDENSNKIEKEDFLKRLTTGDYIPLKLKSYSSVDNYVLLKLDENSNESIKRTMRNEASIALNFYKMEGLPFPEFDFIDIEGDTFTTKNTKGKTIILKTWFINCVACIKEFDELNAFVDSQKENDRILFLSLATDTKEELKKFLLKKPFKYKVVASQNQFISNDLNFNAFPTHVVIDQDGIVRKVVNTASDMIDYFKHNIPVEKELSVVSPSSQ